MTKSARATAPGPNAALFRALVLAGIAVFAVASIVPLVSAPHKWMVVVRWVGIVLLAAAGIRKPTLTYWIFFSMLAGFEIGLDQPHLAENLRVFSDIFLRLIKVIVAPLILGTLITGIAGHGEMKSVGRLGLKSLVYFEVLTTIALVIGLAAINLSKAGTDLNISVQSARIHSEARIGTIPQTNSGLSWQQFLLHVFP